MVDGSVALLFDFLRARQDVVAPTPAPTPFLLPDLFVLGSAVQKAIRRGDLEVARRAAHQLYGLDRQRLWRRLAVTSLEDIGIADIEIVAKVMAITYIPSVRRLFRDSLAALDAALAIACSAVKDRSGDHLYSVAGREPVTPEDTKFLDYASPNALLAVVASSGQPWLRRLRAAFIASGRADGSPGQGGSIATLLEVYRELGVPDLLIAACSVYATRQRDLLPALVPLAWLFRNSGCTQELAERHLKNSELIGDMPAWAFDPVNTRLGRRAVDLFLCAHTMKPPYSSRLVAAAIWNMESALCGRSLVWPLGDEIRRRAYAADLTYRGLPLEQHAVINAWITAQRPALIAARQAVWNSAVKEFGKSAEVPKQANLQLPVPEMRPRRR